MCSFWVDRCHLGLYSVFSFMLPCLHLEKYNLDFVVFWHFYLLLLCFFLMCVWVLFLISPSCIVPVPPETSNLVSGFSVSSLSFGVVLVARTSWCLC